MVVAALSNDAEMFATAVQETFDDDWGLGGMGSTINVMRVMAEDLGTALATEFGSEASVELVRRVIADALAGEVE